MAAVSLCLAACYMSSYLSLTHWQGFALHFVAKNSQFAAMD